MQEVNGFGVTRKRRGDLRGSHITESSVLAGSLKEGEEGKRVREGQKVFKATGGDWTSLYRIRSRRALTVT